MDAEKSISESTINLYSLPSPCFSKKEIKSKTNFEELWKLMHNRDFLIIIVADTSDIHKFDTLHKIIYKV